MIVLAPILLVSLLFYTWTGTTETANPFATGYLAKREDPYNQLTDAFLRGHLSLTERPPAGLISLKDPYDSAQNGYWSGLYHDLVLYKDRFYLTWGPTPVVTLLLPWRILHVGVMPVNVGVIIYCWLGLLFSIALLCLLVDRYLPRTSRWQLGMGAAALALGNVAPFLLRRPDVYELAISSGYCFMMSGAYLLASGGLDAPRRRWKLALGSLSIGLAFGGRPDLVFGGLLLVALLAYVVRKERVSGRADILRWAAPILGPCAAVVALVLAYNYARFGSLFQNGTSYQLAGGIEVSKIPMYEFTTFAPNLYNYLIAPARWTLAFPYISLPPPPDYPWGLPSFYQRELTGGLLTTTPIVLALIPAIPLLARRGLRELRIVMLSLLTVGALTLFFLTIVLPGTTMRYEADYASLFLIPALLGWFALTSGRGRRVKAVLGALLILYGCFVGTAISLSGYYDGLRTAHPRMYWDLARLASPLPTAAAMILGHPVIARVFRTDQIVNGNESTYHLDEAKFGLSSTPVEFDIISPGNGAWSFAPTFSRARDSGSAPLSITVRLDDGRLNQFAIGPDRTGIPLTLHRGLNRITLNATTADPKQLGRDVVSVDGLRLVRT
jgi:hypothetical protein